MKTLRKILLFALTVALALALGAAVSACAPEENEPEHTHDYTEWGISPTEHWRKCPADGAEEPGSRAPHAYTNGKCTCGYEENHVHRYTAWGYSDTEHWRMCPADSVEKAGTREEHHFSDFVTEREPSFGQAGLKKKTCECGKIVTEEIPMLTEDTVLEYSLTFVRSNGMPFTGSVRLSVTVTDAEGNLPLDEQGDQFRGGVYSQSFVLRLRAGASHGVFNVTVSTTSKDHTLLDTSLTLSPDSPEAKIRIKTNPPTQEPRSYKQGDVLKDYTLTSVKGDDDTLTLSDLYKDYKVVLLSFFYVGCRYCQIEIPAILQVYPEYKSEMAIVFLNTVASDTDAAIMEWARKYKIDDFFIARMPFNFTKLMAGPYGNNQYTPVSGVPVSLFVDSEGSILSIHPGAIGHGSDASFATSVADVYAVFDPVMAKVGWTRANASATSLEVILPEKRKIG